ncbi:MAG: aquaporin [Bacteroidota bacterium]
MNKYLIEFIGTFFLVFVICFTSGNYLAPFAIGSMLIAMVYIGENISGAHYNPAVTLAMLIRKKINIKNSMIYMAVQVIGAFVAAYCFYLVWGKNIGVPKPNTEINVLKPLAIEVVFTFAWALAVLSVSTSKKKSGYNGFVIGLIVIAGFISGNSISSGVFNPAVGLGPILIDTIWGTCPCHPVQHLWIYISGPFIGGAIAGIVYKFFDKNCEEIKNER